MVIFTTYYIVIQMSESSLETKQQYLRVNIIEAGYDP